MASLRIGRSRGHLLPRALVVAVTVLVLLAVTAIAYSQAAATAKEEPATTTRTHSVAANATAKPTIVLVHGAWADGSCWRTVTRQLQHYGYTVDAFANPLRSLPGDAAYLSDFLSTISGNIVLVAHSYGGMVSTNAATGNANVKALVYVDAFIPDQGENAFQLAEAMPGSELGGNPSDVFNFAPYPGAPPGDFDLYVKPSVFPHAFAQDLPAKTRAVLAATQRPLTLSAGTQPSGAPAWKSIPSWVLIGTRDNVIPPAEQLVMAQRAKATIVKVRASHLSMLSRPLAVTKLIVRAARGLK